MVMNNESMEMYIRGLLDYIKRIVLLETGTYLT